MSKQASTTVGARHEEYAYEAPEPLATKRSQGQCTCNPSICRMAEVTGMREVPQDSYGGGGTTSPQRVQ
uniref:HDC02770 n=1 Tax=Drosophila melanogaster TaxID=7227 RepID=Q6IHC1_DROME|nr:TPA_inf: HDC02770 [Drosophila melanogaster]